MQAALHITTRVLPGGRIEFTAPELEEGAEIEVFVISAQPSEPATPIRRSALETINSLHGHRRFQTEEEVERYLQEERDSWAR
jgi:hypothetical protein